jgi:hypothetical protein
MKKYSIEKFPKNKEEINLSKEQIKIRRNSKIFTYGKEIVCKKCNKSQPILEFYVQDKLTGRRATTCRDCQLKAAGVVEVGRLRFAKKILEKGFRRCSVCKNTKPINAFCKSKKRYKGYSNNCYECTSTHLRKYQKEQREKISDFYVKQYGKYKGITEFTDKIIKKLRNEIIKKRLPVYFVDGKEFVTVLSFAKYIKAEYNLPITMTLKRIGKGKTEEECKLSENQMRSNAYRQGKIIVTDTITKEVFEFSHTSSSELRKMFSPTAITNGIKTGKPTRITVLSKYKNPCIITRVNK